MKTEIEVIKNFVKKICYRCNGIGHTLINKKASSKLTSFDISPCPHCNGTGDYIRTHYIMIVGKQAFEMDTIK